jgi:DNA polymerase elongation subunit (family B)
MEKKSSKYVFFWTDFDHPDGESDDEETLLKQFVKLLEDRYNTPYHILCGHNAKEFDFPYICRRMLVNGLKLPTILDIAGKKPWEVSHLDTMELWKFGDYKSFVLDFLY